VAPHGDGFSFERPRTTGQNALALDFVSKLGGFLFEVPTFVLFPPW